MRWFAVYYYLLYFFGYQKKNEKKGSTGSIGKSVLDIVQKPGLSCYKNTAELKKQITMFCILFV